MATRFGKDPASYIGRHILDLPTPSFILSRPIIEKNARSMLQAVAEKGLTFRPHVKTLKCVEATRLMLGGKHSKVVVSTLREARGLLPLIEEKVVSEVLYGMPLRPGALSDLAELSNIVKIVVLVDHDQHIDILEKFQSQDPHKQTWEAFVKVDVGARRAGIPFDSPRLIALINRVQQSHAASLCGLYAYGGQSYDCTSLTEAQSVLHMEASSLIKVAAKIKLSGLSPAPLVLSFGTTPTAHVISSLKESTNLNVVLELHPGNYIANDLMQVSTKSVGVADMAARVVVEVSGLYPERNEAIVNAGVLALTREYSSYNGFATVIDHPNWFVNDISQEHGILKCSDSNETVEAAFKIGDKITLHVSHSCITASAYPYYYVVDGNDCVEDVWYPWKGW
ncbi:alanine racemase domain-containing protein [Hypoxylon argillaceum]|nr:alanine racemase domain-containing protein [Hypoxylon argillaceum]